MRIRREGIGSPVSDTARRRMLERLGTASGGVSHVLVEPDLLYVPSGHCSLCAIGRNSDMYLL